MKTIICGRGAETGGKSVQVHVLQTLRELGHDVQGFDPLRHGETSEQRLSALGGLLSYWSPDLVVHVPSQDDLDWESFQALASEYEAMTIAVSSGLNHSDAPVANTRLSELVATHDVVASQDPSQKATYKGAGSYALFDQLLACNVHALDDVARGIKTSESQVLVLGDADSSNAHIVRDLVASDLDVKIVGEGWVEHADLRLLASNCPSLESRVSRIVGTQLVVELPVSVATQSAAQMSYEEAGLNYLALEAVALGKPVVTAERAGVGAHLIPGVEVFTWQQPNEIAQLACMLLSDPDQLNEVALAGQVQVRSNHQSLARWIALFDEFSVIPAPLTSRATSTDDLRVAVIVPVEDGTSHEDLLATVRSITSQTSSASELFIVSSSEIAGDFGSQVNILVAPGTDLVTQVDLAIAQSSSGLLALAKPGETWKPDRLANQVDHLHKNRELDLSHGLTSENPEVVSYNSWTLCRTLIGGQTLIPSTLLVRRSALERLGSSDLMLGDLEAQVFVSTQYRCGLMPAVVVNSSLSAAPVDQVLAQSISSIFPEVERCEDMDQAAVAAFCELGARLAVSHPELSAELCGVALDHLEELDSTLYDIFSGVAEPTAESFEALSARYADEFGAVVPYDRDSVTTFEGRLVGNRSDVVQALELQNP